MKMKALRRKPASIAKTRWAAYAAAGAATALVGSNSAEAAIHYSGDLHEQFGPHKDKAKAFPLDQPGNSLYFFRGAGSQNLALFDVFGIVSGAFRGRALGSTYSFYVSKLPKGSNISAGYFADPCMGNAGILTNHLGYNGYWGASGIGFVGFTFNNGAGVQYGWVRVRMSKLPENAFTVLDYAYADPGEPITAGQRSSDGQAPDQGSLGWLAAGAVGLLAWRKSRSQTAS